MKEPSFDQYKERIPEFVSEVTTIFHFLEEKYGYRCLGLHSVSLNEIRDASVDMRYISKSIGVSIGWGFAEIPEMRVNFFEIIESDIFPKANFIMIKLYELAEYLGHGDDPDFLLQNRDDWRKWKKNHIIVWSNMHEVLAGLARAIEKYAKEILEGDTSLFETMMQFHREKMKKM